MCELHFQPDDIECSTSFFDAATGRKLTAELNKPRLKNGVVPSLLPNCPSYLSSPVVSRESPDARNNRKEEKALQSALVQSVVDQERQKASRTFFSVAELKNKLDFLDQTYWTVVYRNQALMICQIIQSPHPIITRSVVIEDNCVTRVFVNDVKLNKVGNYTIPAAVNDINDLDLILNKLRLTDIREHKISQKCSTITLIHLVISLLNIITDQSFPHLSTLKFLCEQLYLMTLNKLEYSPDLLIFSSLLYNCSRPGYRLLREKKILILPSYSTIRRIFLSKTFGPDLEQRPENFLLYIKTKFKSLLERDKVVTLMVDEIHIKPSYDYKGGNIVGAAYNSAEAATSAFVFMINSLKSKFKDVVHMIPAKSMKAESLHCILKETIVGLENIGFHVLCVITDNNALNGKAMSLFASPPKLSIVYRNPAQSSRPLFFIYDAVHLLKCIRNNWINQRDQMQTMRYPEFSSDGIYYENHKTILAPFKTLRQLYNYDAEYLVKHSYKLSLKAIYPSNLERQNVKLVLQVFNDYVIQALISIGKKYSMTFFSSVAEYIKIICRWWAIMNVQTPCKGVETKNIYSTPLTADVNDEKMKFLEYFGNWLDAWEKIPSKEGKLSRETFTALKHTTHAISELTKYCITELNFKYILTAKLQTDKLEARFGQYRQLAGGNYNVSIRQIFECEKKIRVMSVLQRSLPINDKKTILKELHTEWKDLEESCSNGADKFKIMISKDDIEKCKKVLPVIVYVAGYCCYAVQKKNNCKHCKDLLTYNSDNDVLPENHEYVDGISRGSLMHPNPLITNMVMYNYIVIDKMAKDEHFNKIGNQRFVGSTITYNKLADDEALLSTDSCDAGHSTEKTEKMIIWAATNVLLNNYCARENNVLTENRIMNQGKKRKLETLNKENHKKQKITHNTGSKENK